LFIVFRARVPPGTVAVKHDLRTEQVLQRILELVGKVADG
jgi:hypothetical protein